MKFYTNVSRLGNNILCRGYKENGDQFFSKEEYKPRIFLPSSNQNSEYQSIYGTPCEEFFPGTIEDTKSYLDRYRNVQNFTYYGMENPILNFTAEKFKGKLDVKMSQIKIGFFDIETESGNGFPDIDLANEEVLIVSFYVSGVYHIFSSEKYGVYKAKQENVISQTYRTEKEMLLAVVLFFEKQKFDLISGWNSEYFDIPFLVNRMKKVIGNDWVKRLSPWGIVKGKTVPTKWGDVKSYDIVGVNHIDYLDAFKKFGFEQVENYKLDTVGREILGVAKLDYSEYGTLHQLYLSNWELYCDYNLRDNEILALLEKKKKIFNLIFALALNAKVNLIDVFKQTVLWDSIFYNHLLEKKMIVPKKEPHNFTGKIPGGFVKESRPDYYRWIVSYDLDSLYPHLIMMYNISPETFVGMVDVDLEDLVAKRDCSAIQYAKENNFAIAANGALFRKDIKGFIPELMEMMYEERKDLKRQMLDKKKWLEENKKNLSDKEVEDAEDEITMLNVYQNVRKISLNSAYGSLAQIGFRFFKPELASAITMSGQLSIRWSERKFNELLRKAFKDNDDYVLATDTDSSHVSFDKLVNQYLSKKPNATKIDIVNFLDKFSEEKISPYIKSFYSELGEYVNCYKQAMRMKREAIVEAGIYLAKKKYIYNVWDLEGVRFSEPKLKVTGVELVRSNTPNFCKEKMTEACKIFLEKTQEDLITYIDGVRTEFNGLGFDEVAQPTGVNDVTKYTNKGTYVKGTPIHVRAAILYNESIKKANLDKIYEKIKDGDKLKFCYLKMPNPTFENVIGAPYGLPKEFGLEEYIDYSTQFEKTFMSAVNRIAEARGWDLDKKDTLEDFFG